MVATQQEFMIAALKRLIADAGHIVVGALSPIPGSAALLARHESRGRVRVTIVGSARHTSFTDGGRELFDCAAQGRIDVFFLGGGQIDGEANVNMNGTGPYPQSQVRFPGAFGSAYLYYLVPRVYLFREEHSPRTLVPKVDFITAPGASPPNVYRQGGAVGLLTPRCYFSFDRARRRFTLESVHPGHTVAEVEAETGFGFDRAAAVTETPAPTAAELAALRGPLREAIAETYPRFAAEAIRAA